MDGRPRYRRNRTARNHSWGRKCLTDDGFLSYEHKLVKDDYGRRVDPTKTRPPDIDYKKNDR